MSILADLITLVNGDTDKTLDVQLQEKATTINNNIFSIINKEGTTADTGGTASTGSIFAKLNKLLTDWTTNRAGYLDANISSRSSQASINLLDTKLEVLQQSNYRIYKNIRTVLLSQTVDAIVRIQMPIGVRVLCFGIVSGGIIIPYNPVKTQNTGAFEVKINGSVVVKPTVSSFSFDCFFNLCKKNDLIMDIVFESETYFDMFVHNNVGPIYLFVCDK